MNKSFFAIFSRIWFNSKMNIISSNVADCNWWVYNFCIKKRLFLRIFWIKKIYSWICTFINPRVIIYLWHPILYAKLKILILISFFIPKLKVNITIVFRNFWCYQCYIFILNNALISNFSRINLKIDFIILLKS
jgi:hypothetical protein